jgi:hypothetical protein
MEESQLTVKILLVTHAEAQERRVVDSLHKIKTKTVVVIFTLKIKGHVKIVKGEASLKHVMVQAIKNNKNSGLITP